MKDKTIALLEQITDETVLESIYWFINRRLIREDVA